MSIFEKRFGNSPYIGIKIVEEIGTAASGLALSINRRKFLNYRFKKLDLFR
jgi:hypothetical protein